MEDQPHARDDGQAAKYDVVHGIDEAGADKDVNILSKTLTRLNNVEGTEESGVYFDDGLRKIDLVLAYEGKEKSCNFG